MATDTSSTGRSSDKFMLRFPDGMRDRIAEAAKANNRSMNAEIVSRLEDSFSPAVSRNVSTGQDQLGAVVNSLARTMRHVEALSHRLERMEKAAK